MSGRLFVSLCFLAATATGELALYDIRTQPEQLIGSTLDLGRVSAGDVHTFPISVRNAGTASLSVTRFVIRGAGFNLIHAAPFTLPPGGRADAAIRFSGSAPATYSASLEINQMSVIVLVTAVAAPILTIFPACTPIDPNIVDFGSAVRGQQRICNFNLQNASPQAVSIATLRTTGSAFEGLTGRSVPFTLAAGQTTSFSLRFTPTSVGLHQGTLIIDTQTYQLRGVGLAPPLPKPVLEFDSAPVTSAQQRRLTVRLLTPAPIDATGFLNLSFSPDTSVVKDDPAVVFLPNAVRSMPFAIREGSSEVLLGGAASTVIQTGTTAGRMQLTFSGVPGGFESDPTTTVIIPHAPIRLDSASTARVGGGLEVRLVGFDNTYTAGAMSFRFFDRAGALVDGQAIAADFTANFRQYFTTIQAGSAFQISVNFPVNGAVADVVAVEVEVTNTAGSTRTERLTFP